MSDADVSGQRNDRDYKPPKDYQSSADRWAYRGIAGRLAWADVIGFTAIVVLLTQLPVKGLPADDNALAQGSVLVLAVAVVAAYHTKSVYDQYSAILNSVAACVARADQIMVELINYNLDASSKDSEQDQMPKLIKRLEQALVLALEELQVCGQTAKKAYLRVLALDLATRIDILRYDLLHMNVVNAISTAAVEGTAREDGPTNEQPTDQAGAHRKAEIETVREVAEAYLEHRKEVIESTGKRRAPVISPSRLAGIAGAVRSLLTGGFPDVPDSVKAEVARRSGNKPHPRAQGVG